MKSRFIRKVTVLIALTFALTLGLPSTGAFAINRVYDGCFSGSSFLVINSDNGTYCYANAGTQKVSLSKVNNVDSGNNVVEFREQHGAFYHTRKLAKNQLWLCDSPCTISRITIK